jgi:AraC-like DNA-binding protein
VTDFVRLRLSRNGDAASYVLETVVPAAALDRHYVEAVFAGQVLTMRYLTANQARVIRVHFSYPRPKNTSEHERIFQCPLAFDQPRYEFVIRSADLDLATFLANPVLLERLEGLAQEMLAQVETNAPWSDLVGRWMGKALLSGEKPSLDRAAGELAISARHLQNKLRAEGTTYRELFEQLRQEIALRHLQDPDASLCEIAFLLGFSDQSAFTHAFKRWTGKNPRDYRRRP